MMGKRTLRRADRTEYSGMSIKTDRERCIGTAPCLQSDEGSSFFLLHSFDYFQSCEFLAVLFLQGVRDRVNQGGVHRDRDVLQCVGTLLRLFDIRRQAV